MDKTKNEETSIAIMGNNIGYIQSDIKDIKQSIKELSGVFATKTDYAEVIKVQVDHEARTRDLEKSAWKYVGIYSVITVIISIVLPIIINDFFK